MGSPVVSASTTASVGETDLPKLLASMEPVLSPTPFVYVCIPASSSSPFAAEAEEEEEREPLLLLFKSAVATVQEEEGLTLVLPQSIVDAHNHRAAPSMKLVYTYVASRVTLKVHSSLEAVGLTVAFASRLGQHGISANVVAGFYHDHLFVARKDGERAVEVLKQLAEEARRGIV